MTEDAITKSTVGRATWDVLLSSAGMEPLFSVNIPTSVNKVKITYKGLRAYAPEYDSWGIYIKGAKMENVNEFKTIDELISYFKSKFTIKEIPISRLSDQHKSILTRNAVSSYFNQQNEDKIGESEVKLILFHIENDEISNHYEIDKLSFSETNNLEVVFEYNTNYIYSNSRKLMLELIIEQGLKKEDVEKKSLLYKSYLFYIESYEQLQKD